MNADKKLVLSAIIVLILIGIVSGMREYMRATQQYGIDTDGSSDQSNQVVCTMDAYECPDGTWVGRTGSECRFICPDASTNSESTSSVSALITGELVGTVTLGPTCPVMRNPPDPQCADKPYETTVIVSTNGKEVGRQRTDAQGEFQFSFLPGTYTVTVLGGTTLPRCDAKTVTLSKAATTTVALSCDTGIR